MTQQEKDTIIRFLGTLSESANIPANNTTLLNLLTWLHFATEKDDR